MQYFKIMLHLGFVNFLLLCVESYNQGGSQQRCKHTKAHNQLCTLLDFECCLKKKYQRISALQRVHRQKFTIRHILLWCLHKTQQIQKSHSRHTRGKHMCTTTIITCKVRVHQEMFALIRHLAEEFTSHSERNSISVKHRVWILMQFLFFKLHQ